MKHGAAFSENEYVVSHIARLCGLPVPESFLHSFDGELALVSYRYDRRVQDGITIRLQQEDMCQASGIKPENKYESDGGVGIRDIVSLITRYSSQPAVDLMAFVDSVVFNFLIGNCDAHGKNYSFLYGKDRYDEIRLAPFYDLMSTTVYPNLSRELAMKIGKERRIDRIVRSDFDLIIGVPKNLVSRSINNIASKLKGVFETYPENEILSDHSVFLSKLAVEAMPRIKRITDEKIS